MSRGLWLKNRRRHWVVDLKLLRKIVRHVLEQELKVEDYELGVFLVGDKEMTALNEGFLRHAGSTDVITFDYGEGMGGKNDRSKGYPTVGEIFICLDEAERQARRFRTSWQAEVARYVIHGLLHLLGYDDLQAAARRTMKRQEDRRVRALARNFTLGALGAKRRPPLPRPSLRR